MDGLEGCVVEFYPDGESNHRSEKLDIKWSESLIAKVGKCICGRCRLIVHEAEEIMRCPSPACGIDWQQVIHTETTVSFHHHRLAMFGKAVLPMFERPKPSAATPSYPFIGRRAVEDIVVINDIL